MKSVGEFSSLKLADGVKAKAALAAEGKTPEEISTALGEKFKYEGDKLTYFVAALEIAEKSTEKLFAVKVGRLNEGEKAPNGSTVVEDICYVAETYPSADKKAAPPTTGKSIVRGAQRTGGKPGGGKGKGKDSPWGISPEEKEAKLAAARQAAREKSLAGKA